MLLLSSPFGNFKLIRLLQIFKVHSSSYYPIIIKHVKYYRSVFLVRCLAFIVYELKQSVLLGVTGYKGISVRYQIDE